VASHGRNDSNNRAGTSKAGLTRERGSQFVFSTVREQSSNIQAPKSHNIPNRQAIQGWSQTPTNIGAWGGVWNFFNCGCYASRRRADAAKTIEN
jgi:hypothetical protein